MKKKLLSLLLAFAIMVTSVSMGFGSIGAFAAHPTGATGKGVEAINAFSLVDNDTDGVTGTTFSTTITIKSTESNYKIKVNSVTATIRYADNDTDTVGSVTVQDAVNGAICGTGGETFIVSGSIPDGKAGLIRYECNYDLLDANGNVVVDSDRNVLAGLTGYGYGYASANGEQTGARGDYYGKPGNMNDGRYFESLVTLNSCYVQMPTLTGFTYKCRGQSAWNHKDACTRGVGVVPDSGNAPSTLKFMVSGDVTGDGATMQWPAAKTIKRYTEGVWLEMSTPPTGYYHFTISFNLWNDSWDDQSNITETTTMYWLADTDKNSALSVATTALNKNLEKSYYTEASWNEYIKALEYAQIAGRAIPQPNNPFKIACQNATSASSLIATAESKLVHGPADWTGPLNAYYELLIDKVPPLEIKEELNKTEVYTYTSGATAPGDSIFVAKYQDAAKADFEKWFEEGPYAHYVAGDIYRYEQAKVDDYTAETYNRFNNLACNDAVYKYLNIAISDYETLRQKHEATNNRLYTESTWSAYENEVNEAKRLVSLALKTDSQATVNNQLVKIIENKNQLDFGPADTTELLVQIGRAAEVYEDYNNGRVLTALEGFDSLWTDFEADYATANNVKGYKMDKQATVDEAAENLRIAIDSLSGYRLLDVTKLDEVVNTYPVYSKDKYVPESYSAWNDLWIEGMDFKEKALPDYTGDDRKTYDDYDDMIRLIEAIENAYNSLEKVKADFSEINELVADIPDEDVLALYKDDVVAELKSAVGEINYGATFDEQNSVDATADKIRAALAKLDVYDNYKGANYDEVDNAIAKAGALDRSLYENFETVDNAISAVDRTKKIIEQDEVDAMAAAINTAIDNLEYILANYEEVNKAIERAKEYEANKHWYSNYYRVENAINAVDRNKNWSQQAEVDAMAKAINDAIDNLIEAGADYSGVEAAIAEYNALAPLSDFTSESLARVDDAINTIDWKILAKNQEEVNAKETEIRNAIAQMELRGADYSSLNATIANAQSLDSTQYTNYNIVTEAINNVNWDLNCRQNAEMQQQIKAIQDAVKQLELYPADYKEVKEAITAARDAYTNTQYPYTEDSINEIEKVIDNIDWDLKINDQTTVDGYVLKIQNAVAGLKYVRADYTKLDEYLEEYRALDRDLYASLVAIDAYVSKIDMNITIDKQSLVEDYETGLRQMLDSLEFAPADYSGVKYQIDNFNEIDRNLYEDEDVAEVEQVIEQVVYGLKKNEQDRVDNMAKAIEDALNTLKTKMKKANLEALLDAVEKANERVAEMNATGHQIDTDTLRVLNRYIVLANSYNADTTINKQSEIDENTANIIEATANLEFVFKIILEEPIVIDESGYIYGFKEGTNSDDARALIGFVGAAELKIYETKNGFGTGTMVQFVSTKDGSILGTYTVIVFGDANGDSVIDTFDDAYLAELVNEGVTGSGMYLKALDLDKSGCIDVNDLTIMISLANLDYTLKQDGSMERY